MSTSRDRKTVGVDFDGVLHEHPDWTPVDGRVDVTLIRELHKAGFAVAVITANEVRRVAASLRGKGIKVLADERCSNGTWFGGKDGRLVLVTNRKVAASMYVDDRAMRWEFGREVKEVVSELTYRSGFASCAGGRHWGPRGAAGILPYAVVNGEVFVLVGKRGRRVSQPGTWGGFGGALEHAEGPWEGAVRELGEEVAIRLDAATDYHAVRHTYVYRCPSCKWTYTTYLVELDGRQGVPDVWVKDKWETDYLQWANVYGVGRRALHPGFTSAWKVFEEHLIREYRIPAPPPEPEKPKFRSYQPGLFRDPEFTAPDMGDGGWDADMPLPPEDTDDVEESVCTDASEHADHYWSSAGLGELLEFYCPGVTYDEDDEDYHALDDRDRPDEEFPVDPDKLEKLLSDRPELLRFLSD